MNNKLMGQIFAWVAGTATLLFGVFMLLPDPTLSKTLSYTTSTFISIGYLGMACVFAVQASEYQKASAWLGMTLAAIYFVFINLVYYTQLSTVRLGAGAPDVLNAITYSPGTWFFNLDLFGYGVMSLSTFFLGLTLKPACRSDKWLKGFMLSAGIFAVSSFIMPLLNLFSAQSGTEGEIFGVLVLEFWCIYFIPVTLLSGVYFKKGKTSGDK